MGRLFSYYFIIGFTNLKFKIKNVIRQEIKYNKNKLSYWEDEEKR
tara:strand:- start:730 stop:864 length:135 start_codon:yes stop_codon:yes gene_type:complete